MAIYDYVESDQISGSWVQKGPAASREIYNVSFQEMGTGIVGVPFAFRTICRFAPPYLIPPLSEAFPQDKLERSTALSSEIAGFRICGR